MLGEVGVGSCKTGHTEQLYLSKYLKNVSHVCIRREEYSRQSKWQV